MKYCKFSLVKWLEQKGLTGSNADLKKPNWAHAWSLKLQGLNPPEKSTKLLFQGSWETRCFKIRPDGDHFWIESLNDLLFEVDNDQRSDPEKVGSQIKDCRDDVESHSDLKLEMRWRNELKKSNLRAKHATREALK